MSQSKSVEMVRVEFHGQEIEAVWHDGKVWVVLKRICENLGIASNSQRTKIQNNPSYCDRWYDIILPSPGGPQGTLCLDLEALALWLGSISASKLKKASVRDAVIRYQRECMTVLRNHFFGPKEAPAPDPITPTRALLAQVQALVALEDRTLAIETRLAKREEEEREAALALLAMPEPNNPPQPRSVRSLIVEYVRQVAFVKSLKYGEIWRELYREYGYRYHIDLQRKAKNRNIKPLDMAQELGVLQELYNLCCHLWTFNEEELRKIESVAMYSSSHSGAPKSQHGSGMSV